VDWEKYVDVRINELEKATTIASEEMNRRLEGMNEIRSQLDRQANSFLTKDAFEAYKETIMVKLGTITSKEEKREGAIGAYHLIVTAVVSVVTAFVLFLIFRGF
jgi:hypothetical protein